MAAKRPAALLLRPAARADLEDIWRYTARHWSAAQAGRYILALDSRMQAICRHPEAAAPRPELDPPVRIVPEGAHLIVYRLDGDSVDVLRVLHQSRSWPGLL